VSARPAQGQHIGRPKALDKSKDALVRRMHTSGEAVSMIATTLGVSRGQWFQRATWYTVARKLNVRISDFTYGCSEDVYSSYIGEEAAY
jgi:DNA invertase Pin-like site-specific DNA recombinase